MKNLFCALALLMITSLSSASLIDLDDYILNTGSNNVKPTVAIPIKNETTGNYTALVMYGKGNELVGIGLTYSKIGANINEANLTAEGYIPVKKPYPGFMYTNNTTDEVEYIGKVNDNLLLAVKFQSYQVAINQLPEMAVITREEYQAMKSAELLESLN